MKLKKLFRIKKSRKYPIKYDEEGLSLRAKCFELFELRKRPTVVAEELKMNETTVCRYFRDWKRLGPNFERKYAFIKSLFKKNAPDRDKNIELFARAWGIAKEHLEGILSRPHGLRRLMTGKFYFPGTCGCRPQTNSGTGTGFADFRPSGKEQREIRRCLLCTSTLYTEEYETPRGRRCRDRGGK